MLQGRPRRPTLRSTCTRSCTSSSESRQRPPSMATPRWPDDDSPFRPPLSIDRPGGCFVRSPLSVVDVSSNVLPFLASWSAQESLSRSARPARRRLGACLHSRRRRHSYSTMTASPPSSSSSGVPSSSSLAISLANASSPFCTHSLRRRFSCSTSLRRSVTAGCGRSGERAERDVGVAVEKACDGWRKSDGW